MPRGRGSLCSTTLRITTKRAVPFRKFRNHVCRNGGTNAAARNAFDGAHTSWVCARRSRSLLLSSAFKFSYSSRPIRSSVSGGSFFTSNNRHSENCGSAGYCSSGFAVASVGVTHSPPLVIGATGGSGTRVIERIAKHAGYNLGRRLNSSEDALEFYSFHDIWINPFVSAQGRGEAMTPWQSARMKEDFHAALARHIPEAERRGKRWGWKAPRSIYLLPFLSAQFPQLKFIHVLRDGRDMALSQNQNQLRKHGRAVLGWRERLFRSTPERSVLLWEKVNSQAADYGKTSLRESYLRVRFEDLCAKPLDTTAQILNFLEAAVDPEPITRAEITPPRSLGRWKTCSPAIISKLEATAATSLHRFGYLE